MLIVLTDRPFEVERWLEAYGVAIRFRRERYDLLNQSMAGMTQAKKLVGDALAEIQAQANSGVPALGGELAEVGGELYRLQYATSSANDLALREAAQRGEIEAEEIQLGRRAGGGHAAVNEVLKLVPGRYADFRDGTRGRAAVIGEISRVLKTFDLWPDVQPPDLPSPTNILRRDLVLCRLAAVLEGTHSPGELGLEGSAEAYAAITDSKAGDDPRTVPWFTAALVLSGFEAKSPNVANITVGLAPLSLQG